MARIFVYDDREFPDPDPQMSVDQVKATLSDFYGEIANASVKETKRGDDTIYEFQRRVGTKGAFTDARGWGGSPMDNRTFAGLLATTPPALSILELTAELTRPDLERLQMPIVGPHPSLPPTPYGDGIDAETTGDLHP